MWMSLSVGRQERIMSDKKVCENCNSSYLGYGECSSSIACKKLKEENGKLREALGLIYMTECFGCNLGEVLKLIEDVIEIKEPQEVLKAPATSKSSSDD